MYLCQSKKRAKLDFRYAVASAASIKQAIYNNNVFYTVYSHIITIMDNSFFVFARNLFCCSQIRLQLNHFIYHFMQSKLVCRNDE